VKVYDVAERSRQYWDRPRFTDPCSGRATIPAEPLGQLRAQEAPPIQSPDFKTGQLTEQNPVLHFRYGAKLRGLVRMHVKGPAGTRIKMRYGDC